MMLNSRLQRVHSVVLIWGGTSFLGSMFSGFQSTSPETGVVGARNSANSIPLQRCPLIGLEIPSSMRFPTPNFLSPMAMSHSQQQFQTSMPHQNRSDANKVLSKNGMQINGVLIVGVKPVDSAQRQVLNERMNNPGFMSLPPQPWSKSSEPNPLRASSTPYHLQNDNTGARQSSSYFLTIADLVEVVDILMIAYFLY